MTNMMDWLTSDAGFTNLQTLMVCGFWMAAGIMYGKRNP